MGFRFWRRIKIAPGITLNLSKSGGSLSFGPRGAKFTVGSRGERVSLGIPGTGLFYTTTFSKGSRKRKPEVHPEDRLDMGFFKRLITPDNEEALVDGLRELALGEENEALKHFEKALHLADGAFLAGFLALKQGNLDKAREYLMSALDKHRELGKYLDKYGLSATLSLPITYEVTAHVGPDLRGVLLGLVEVYQRQRNYQQALDCLERLLDLEPEDVVVKLSLAELLLEASPGEKETCQKVVRLAEGVTNETPVHTALMLYKARALKELGFLEAARDTLSQALRRKKDRPPELLKALRYERALIYHALGQKKRARADLERLYSQDPGYKDVAERLGM